MVGTNFAKSYGKGKQCISKRCEEAQKGKKEITKKIPPLQLGGFFLFKINSM